MSAARGLEWVLLVVVSVGIVSCQTFLDDFTGELERLQNESDFYDMVYGELSRDFCASTCMVGSGVHVRTLLQSLYCLLGFALQNAILYKMSLTVLATTGL